MIYSVRGPLLHKEPGMAVVECAGVGYKCLTSLNTLSRLPQRGEEVTLFTHLNVREDAVDLFGFYDQSELNCFKMLTSVSGVGPKAGLAILSVLSPDQVALSVVGGDAKALTRAAGVGPKLAQRIVLELKDKLKNVELVFDGKEPAAHVSLDVGNAGEAIAALTVLGYTQSEAAGAVARLDSALPVEELIKRALKALSGSKA